VKFNTLADFLLVISIYANKLSSGFIVWRSKFK